MASQKDTDALAARVQQAIERERVLPKLVALHSDIDSVYSEAARSIRKRLRATGFTDAEVARVVNEELSRAIDSQLPKVREAMRSAALAGNEAQREQFVRVFGQQPEQAAAELAEEVGESAPFARSASPRRKRHLTLLPSGSEDS